MPFQVCLKACSGTGGADQGCIPLCPESLPPAFILHLPHTGGITMRGLGDYPSGSDTPLHIRLPGCGPLLPMKDQIPALALGSEAPWEAAVI